MPVPLSLDEAQIRARFQWRDLFSVLERALIAFSGGLTRQPVRSVIDFPSGCLFTMPAWLADPPALGAKLVTICEQNAASGIATHQATLVMLHPETGELLALLDGGVVTQLRTAAVSALSVRELARSDAKVLAILGSGVQARGHAEALPLIRNFEEIRAWSPTPAHLEHFVAEACGKVRAAQSAESATRDADVVVLATSSHQPVVSAAWIRPGAHVISVGAPRPHQREIDPVLLHQARLFVDSRASALAESGDIVQGIVEGVVEESCICAELGEVLANRIHGRQSQNEITLFKSLGLAVEDVATGALLLHCHYDRG